MLPMSGTMGGGMAVYGILWLIGVGVGLTAAWRAMRAHEAVAAHLAAIAAALGHARDGSR